MTPSTDVQLVRLADAVQSIPAPCRERSTPRGLWAFGGDVALYAAAVALLWSDEPWRLAVGWPLAAVAIAALFVLGHDAAHGALFDSPRLCRIVGRLAMLPSLHAYSVWAWGHNRVHHTFTTCADIDAVWHPVTPAEWQAATPLKRLLCDRPRPAGSTRRCWTKLRGQIEGTTALHMPWWVDLVSHNIFHHVAHHVDPRIPFYHLPEASRALRRRFGGAIPSRAYGLGDYGRITRRCKLFDFERGAWVGYPATVE